LPEPLEPFNRSTDTAIGAAGTQRSFFEKAAAELILLSQQTMMPDPQLIERPVRQLVNALHCRGEF
jgi:hypothetical protein